MLNSEITYLSAFLVGLLGGVHCVTMCGGIVGALSFGVPAEKGRAPWPFLLAMGAFAMGLRNLVQRAWLRQLAGSLIMGFGLLNLWRVISS